MFPSWFPFESKIRYGTFGPFNTGAFHVRVAIIPFSDIAGDVTGFTPKKIGPGAVEILTIPL
jgi:hypothetical protein